MDNTISVIIPTRNRIKVLENTLISICSGSLVPKEIIIVDQSDIPLKKSFFNNEILKKTTIKLFHLSKPSSTIARNLGIKQATSEIVLFVDDDIALDKSSIEKIGLSFNDPCIALVDAIDIQSRNIKRHYPSLFGYVFLRKKPFKKGGYICKGAVLGRYPRNINSFTYTEWAMGYLFAIRKSVLDELKIKFEEKFKSYAYAEDLDFTYRFIKEASKQGYKAVINPDIYVQHLSSREWRIPAEEATIYYVMNRYFVSYKNFKNPLYRLALIWSDVGEFIRRILTREHPLTLAKAHIFCLKNRKSLKQGLIPIQQ
ncbi:MAG: hypothetical protein ACFWUE_00320 [Xylanivirga thermophila]|uniref:glycosyltransferase family 2 protein n=1 Tax=Xylanivirga thermophila TaxID=2496273 RepID=UPI0039F64623